VCTVRWTQAEPLFLSSLNWNADGLIPAIIQDSMSSEVLMMAWMNEAALQRTLERGETHFYSRSRKEQWHKGSTSGHIQLVESIRVDCDGDVLLIKVRQVGGACHEGYRTCFYRRVDSSGGLEVTEVPAFDRAAVYPAPDRRVKSRGHRPPDSPPR
jgi:phosphoribosyl-AMP cyclohydrolase